MPFQVTTYPRVFPFRPEATTVWRLEDGVIVETWFFFSWAAALAAAGIEQPVN